MLKIILRFNLVLINTKWDHSAKNNEYNLAVSTVYT